MNYVKMSDLIGQTFTVEKIWGYKFKMFDQETKKMIISETPIKGGRKVYEVDTDKGKLDMGQGQIGTLLETVFKNGTADLNDKTFSVKSNGKTGMDIRYYFDEVKGQVAEDFNLDNIPF